MESNNDKTAYPNVLYSHYFLSAKSIMRVYNKDERRNPYAARQRLEGVRDVMKYALMHEKDPFQFDKLNGERILIAKWIEELKVDHKRLLEEREINLLANREPGKVESL